MGIGGFFYEGGSPDWRENIPRTEQANVFETDIPIQARDQGINSLELLAIFYAFKTWTARFTHCHIVVNTDNKTAFHGLQSLRLRGASNEPLRKCLRLAAAADITINPAWLTSEDNTLADALSRHDRATAADICAHWQNPFFST